MQKASVLAVILNWNGADHTLRCAAHVLAQTGVSADLVIIDNGSDDDSVVRIRDAGLPTRLLELESNQGFAGGMNAGLREALLQSYPYVWLLNSDAFAEPDCLDQLVERMSRGPTLAMVTPRLMSEDGIEQHAGGTVDWNTGVLTALPSRELVSPSGDQYWLTGTAPLVRVASVATAGLFEPSFFAYWEDVNLSVRLTRAGWTLAAVPDAVVHHVGSASSGLVSPFFNFLYTRNTWLFLERNALIGPSGLRWTRFVSSNMMRAAQYEAQGATTIANAVLAGISAARQRRYGAPDATFEPAPLERSIFEQRWVWDQIRASDQGKLPVTRRLESSDRQAEAELITPSSNHIVVGPDGVDAEYKCQICGQPRALAIRCAR